MSKQTLDIDSGIALLSGLALDLRWWWNHAADPLWSKLDAALVLQSASRKRLAQLLASSEFRDTLRQR
jgi:glycogen phosphorylase